MLTYEQCLEKARKVKRGINSCKEFKGAYAFFHDTDVCMDGGDSPVVVLKDTGEALNFVGYAVKHGHEVIRDFKVE